MTCLISGGPSLLSRAVQRSGQQHSKAAAAPAAPAGLVMMLLAGKLKKALQEVNSLG